MTSNDYSFTPVRRREPLFENNDPDADSKHWTAARCNRLLRSLQSRVELLKKDAAQFIPAARPAEATNNTTENHIWGKRSSSALHSDGHGDGGAKPKKRVRVTYKGRSRPKAEAGRSDAGNEAKPTSLNRGFPPISRPPGEISVETPILTRRIWPDDGISRASILEENGPPNMLSFSERVCRRRISPELPHPGTLDYSFRMWNTSLRQLQLETCPKIWKLYKGVLNALDSLLRTTEQADAPVPARSNSLFSLCLRNVHQRIQVEEHWEAIDTETAGVKSILRRDISGEIYAQLEDIGTSEHGWKHLRTVVRAHGVQIVADAISSGLINQGFGGHVVMSCLQMSSYPEAEVLLSALLSTMPNTEPATTYSRIADIPELSPLLTLEKYVTETGRTAQYFRMMTDIFGGGAIAIQWLATKELSGLWTRVFRAISAEPACQNATKFLQEILPLMLNASAGQSKRDTVPVTTRVSEAIGTTFSSVLATLAAVVILDEASDESGAHSLTGRGRNVINILRHLHIEYSIPPAELRGQVNLVFLANILATPLRDAGDKRCDQLIQLLQQACQSSRGAIDPEIAEFMCSVARCCGRGLSGTGLEHFKRFSLLIEACTSSAGSEKKRHLLQNIIVSSAYVFSQQVPIAAHLDYADDIRAKFQIHPELGQGGKSSGSKPTEAFRWEEGISEWVAPTPTVVKKTRHDINALLWDDIGPESSASLFREFEVLQGPSFLTKRENSQGQRVAGRVSDLIPSSPSTYGSDSTRYDEGDTVFSDIAPLPKIASAFSRKSTALQDPTPTFLPLIKKRDGSGAGAGQHGRGWSVYGETTTTREEKDDMEEEDELSVSYVLPEEKKISVMTEAQSNSRLSLGGRSRRSGIMNHRKAVRQMEEEDDFSGDELSF